MNGSILNYGQYRYLILSAILALGGLALYLSESPDAPPNGGTWQGYALGIISTTLILFLLWFGVRKRQYHSTKTSLNKWASAHVYLGISLPVLVSLHCGFQFGWNVHTLAYALMVLVVLSGFYGLYAYLTYPNAITANRGGVNRKQMIEAIARFDETGLTLAEDLGAEIHHQVLREVEQTRIGATIYELIPRNSGFKIAPALQFRLAGSFVEATQQPTFNLKTLSLESFLHGYLRKSKPEVEIHQVAELLKVMNERQAMVSRLQRDIRYHAFIKCWLFLHVPLSCALVSAVLVHVISVFFYW